MKHEAPGKLEKIYKISGDKWNRVEDEGVKNILKHFDRIQDKLFTFNNILIAGYFVMAKFEHHGSLWLILIPIANLIFLISIEYIMMERGRFQSRIKSVDRSEIDTWNQRGGKVVIFSILIILSTTIVTVIFLISFLNS
ncbi:MAG TPA: hypothetical protein VFG10_11710 [Saprospiraceae bacterium]|nr:hypothetical protein [Saprospiraceae bacterium]